MGAVMAQIVRNIIAVSRGPVRREALLESAGLSRPAAGAGEVGELVSADAYYEVLERCYGQGDAGLPFRYGAAVRAQDFGALGLALATARSAGEALSRLVRYALVVSDTLEYQLRDTAGGRVFVLQGRPFERRRGVQLANECALSAVVSLISQVAVDPVVPGAVSFRHPMPEDTTPHEAYFGCPVTFGAELDALHFSEGALATKTRLGDELDRADPRSVSRVVDRRLKRSVTREGEFGPIRQRNGRCRQEPMVVGP